MYFADLVVATALLSTAAWATPLTKRSQFSISQVAVPCARKSGLNAIEQVFRKYGMTLPPAARLAIARSNAQLRNSTVAAIPNAGDNEYTSRVTIGGQTVNLDFDTGSSDLWVYSSLLPLQHRGNHSIYDPKHSTTAVEMPGSTWNISYGDGSSASGNVWTDTVSVGTAVVQKQAVELASTVSAAFLQDASNDGLLGLGFDKGNTITPTPQKTFFTSVKPSLALPLFTVDLKHQAAGSYDFGHIDRTKYSGEIVYLDADSSAGFWGVTSTSFGVGSDGTHLVQHNVKAIIDTGTTLLLVPQALLTAYYSKVPGSSNSKAAGGYIFPCDAALPDFFIGFGAYTARISASAINTGKWGSDATSCMGGIQFSPPNDGPDAIYGDVFLKSSFVVFSAPEGMKPQLGFAAKADAPRGSTKPTSTGGILPVPTATPSQMYTAPPATSSAPGYTDTASPATSTALDPPNTTPPTGPTIPGATDTVPPASLDTLSPTATTLSIISTTSTTVTGDNATPTSTSRPDDDDDDDDDDDNDDEDGGNDGDDGSDSSSSDGNDSDDGSDSSSGDGSESDTDGTPGQEAVIDQSSF